MDGGDKRAEKEALFGDLAAKLAAGPPKKPVGLVKKEAYGLEQMKEEDKVPASSADEQRKAAMAELGAQIASKKS